MNKCIFFGISTLVLVLCCTGYLLVEESDEASASGNGITGSVTYDADKVYDYFISHGTNAVFSTLLVGTQVTINDGWYEATLWCEVTPDSFTVQSGTNVLRIRAYADGVDPVEDVTLTITGVSSGIIYNASDLYQWYDQNGSGVYYNSAQVGDMVYINDSWYSDGGYDYLCEANPSSFTVQSSTNTVNVDSYIDGVNPVGTGSVYITTGQYKVTIATNNINWGIPSQSNVWVDYGTSISVNGDTLTVGSTTVTATPHTSNAQYRYAFDMWSGIPAGGTVTGDTFVTAYFSRTAVNTVTINVNNAEYGSVSQQSVTVDYGTSISVNGDTVTIGSTQITATPTTSDAQYTYAFDSWSGIPAGGTVTDNLSVTANFTRTVNNYRVTFNVNNAGYGSVIGIGGNQVQSIGVQYGTSISASGNVLTLGPAHVTAIPTPTDAQYTYMFDSWSGIPAGGTVTGDITVTANFTRLNNYTVTINVNPAGYGSISPNTSSFTVADGTSISASGNVLTLGPGHVTTATPTTSDAQYTYAFDSWSGVPAGGTVTGDTIVTANFTRTVNQYTVTIVVNNANYGSVSQQSLTVDYNTVLHTNGNVLYVGSDTVTATPSSATAQYTYAFNMWTFSPNSNYVRSDVTVTAVFNWTVNQYTVTFTMDSGSGSWTYPTIEVDYGSTISWLDNVVLVNDVSNTFTTSAVSDTESYSFEGFTGIPADGIIVGDITVYAETEATFSIPAIFIIQPKVGDENIIWSMFKLLPIIILVVIIVFGAKAFFTSRDDE